MIFSKFILSQKNEVVISFFTFLDFYNQITSKTTLAYCYIRFCMVEWIRKNTKGQKI